MSDPTFPISSAQKEKARSGRMQAALKNFLDLTVRRKWLIGTLVLLGVIVGGGLAWINKDVFRSSAILVVEQERRHEGYGLSGEDGDVAERVSRISQRILSRTHLRNVVDEFNLSPDIVNAQGYEAVIGGLRENIKIEMKSDGRELEALLISFAHHNPMTAMKVTTKLASQYIHEYRKMQEPIIDRANEVLQQELVIAKNSMTDNESVLNEYARRFLRELPGQLETNLRALDRLQLEKMRIQESLQRLQSRLVLVRKSIINHESQSSLLQEQANGNEGEFSVRQLAQLKKTLEQMIRESSVDNPGIDFLTRQIEKLEAVVARHESSSHESEQGDSDPYLGEIRNEREEVTTQIASLRSQLKKTSVAMAALEGRIQRTPEREQELLVLERAYDRMKENYQHLQQKQINGRMSDTLKMRQKIEEIHIFDAANFPSTPEGRPRIFLVLGGLAGGVGLGLGLAMLLDVFFPTFRRSADVELSLGFPLLATIPRFQLAYGKPVNMLSPVVESPMKKSGSADGTVMSDYVDAAGMGRRKSVSQGRTSTHLQFSAQLNLVSRWRPQSVVAEQFRVAATRLDLLGDRPMGNVVLVSSAMKGEGKTSTVANLAYTLARDLDEPTLVIDCDYKRPNVHNVFDVHPYPGVADYLAGQDSLESCFQQYSDVPLWCMSVGDVETNPVSLAKLQYLSVLIESVRSRYRFIMLDGPPILPLADINVLSRLADIVLMVVRSGTTPKDVVQKASEMLQNSCPIRMILTDAWSQGVPNYVGHRYSNSKLLSRQS